MADKILDAAATSLHSLMERDEQWRCPIFQRRYEWGRKEIHTLWEDIEAVLGDDPESQSRFLGAILIDVASPSGAGKTQENWLVDGQQRFTTFYLLVCAVVDLLADVEGDPEPPIATSADFAEQYLFGTKAFNKSEPRIHPTIQDTAQLNRVLRQIQKPKAKLPPDYGPTSGKLVNAFNMLQRLVRVRCGETEVPQSALSAEKLRNFLREIMDRLALVEIQLGEEHDAYEVFERLNTSGMKLEAADLVRNFVFHRAALEAPRLSDVQALYDELWRPLEESFASQSAFEGFFFPFGLIHQPQITKSLLFGKLRERWAKETENLSGLDAARWIIQDIREYVPAYNALSGHGAATSYPAELREAVERVARMPAPSVTYPYLLQIVREFEKKTITAKAAADSISTVEAFLVRRAFAGMEPTGLHAVFKRLFSTCGADPSKVAAHIDSNPTIVYPSDVEFSNSIGSSDLYHRHLAKFVVLEHERYIAGGKVDDGATIDHVMPQALEDHWVKGVGADVHKRWLHTWANLVPLSSPDNSTKGTMSWVAARAKLGNETHYKTTKDLLASYDSWGEAALKQRSRELTEWALKRWAKPVY